MDGQQDEDWRSKVPPTVSKDQVCDHLRYLNVLKSVGPIDGFTKDKSSLTNPVALHNGIAQ